MTEVARLLLGLHAAGWTEKEINGFVLYIESREEQYKCTADYEKKVYELLYIHKSFMFNLAMDY